MHLGEIRTWQRKTFGKKRTDKTPFLYGPRADKNRIRQKKTLPNEHWLGSDGNDVRITLSGKLLTVKILKPPSKCPCSKGRSQVTTFSKASRLRILKLLARIDFTKAEPALFVTLTFPDRETQYTRKELNTYRYLFLRYTEKELGRKVSGIWRIEWKERKTGISVGEERPHFHLMLFDVRWIDRSKINSFWQKSIGTNSYVRTEVQRMRSEKECGSYVAKYCAKVEDSSLVNAAYLNNRESGRHWGIHRKNLLPLHPERTARMATGPLEEELRKIAGERFPHVLRERCSFTLMGNIVKVKSWEGTFDFMLDDKAKSV